eukprot:scaffold14742_cov58-Phaeocystis_antarctica.AAC.2
MRAVSAQESIGRAGFAHARRKGPARGRRLRREPPRLLEPTGGLKRRNAAEILTRTECTHWYRK